MLKWLEEAFGIVKQKTDELITAVNKLFTSNPLEEGVFRTKKAQALAKAYDRAAKAVKDSSSSGCSQIKGFFAMLAIAHREGEWLPFSERPGDSRIQVLRKPQQILNYVINTKKPPGEDGFLWFLFSATAELFGKQSYLPSTSRRTLCLKEHPDEQITPA